MINLIAGSLILAAVTALFGLSSFLFARKRYAYVDRPTEMAYGAAVTLVMVLVVSIWLFGAYSIGEALL